MLDIKHKLHFSLIVAAILASVVVCQILLLGTASAQARQRVTCPDGFSTLAPFSERDDICRDHQTGSEQRDSEEPGAPVDNGNTTGDCNTTDPTKENCGIISYLVTFINALSAIVGIVIVIMITVGGIQYSTARDNPQAAVVAKTRITNAVMALVFFMFIYAFLQYVVPGGVL